MNRTHQSLNRVTTAGFSRQLVKSFPMKYAIPTTQEGSGMKEYLIGFAIGLIIALAVFIYYVVKRANDQRAHAKEVARLKNMLSDRMDIESEGLRTLKEENAELKKQNENLRITLNTLSQKPGRKEVNRLQVYQLAVDRLTINSPGFGPAWQAALKESEEEFQKNLTGATAFIKRLIPIKTDAAVLPEKID